MKASIIVPYFAANDNLAKMTAECVHSIMQTVDLLAHELILIDNGSPLIAPAIQTGITIRNAENVGYGPAVNQGIKVASGDVFVPINNDVVVTAGWLAPLLDALAADSTLGVIRPLDTSEPKRKFAEPRVSIDQRDYHGFCYALPRRVVDAVGMFDEAYAPAYCEDMDLWVRITKAGYRMAKHTESRVTHRGAGNTTHARGEDSVEQMTKNRRYFISKHGFDVFTPEWYSAWQQLVDRYGAL